MLRYDAKPTPLGLRVRFERKPRWTGPIMGVIAFACLFKYFHLIGEIAPVPDPPLRSIVGHMLGGMVALWIFAVAIAVVYRELRGFDYTFAPEHICVTTHLVGIKIGENQFNATEIHNFGRYRRSHFRTWDLSFRASGALFVMANNVAPLEADQFLDYLRERGLDYSPEDEPVRRKNAANTFLG